MSAPAPLAAAYRPSEALRQWRTEGREAIEHLLAARRAVGGRSLARRAAARQIDHALTVLYAAQFQRYCRELHSECVRVLATQVGPGIGGMFAGALLHGRRLERQNAQPASIGADFRRLDIGLWDELYELGPRYAECRRRLEQLNAWRNAVAHQDFRHVGTDPLIAGVQPDHKTLRTWRRALDELAHGMDRVVFAGLSSTTGGKSW